MYHLEQWTNDYDSVQSINMVEIPEAQSLVHRGVRHHSNNNDYSDEDFDFYDSKIDQIEGLNSYKGIIKQLTKIGRKTKRGEEITDEDWAMLKKLALEIDP